MKKAQSVLLALALSMTLAPAAPARAAYNSLDNFYVVNTYNEEFPDVPGQAWFHDAVKVCYEHGLMNGVGGGFNPDGQLTVGQALTMADRVHEIYSTGASTLSNGKPWYRPYVDYALAHNLISYEWDSYTRPITRREMAGIFCNALPAEVLYPINFIDAIPDVSRDDAYGPEIYTLYQAGVLTGKDGAGSFLPNDPIIRAEAAAILARMALPDQRVSFSLGGQTDLPSYTDLVNAPVTLVEERGVVVEAAGYATDGILGPTVNLHITNYNDTPLQISCPDLVVNGFMIHNELNETVSPNSEIYAYLGCDYADIQRAGIPDVSRMEMDFCMTNLQNGDIWYSGLTQLTTTYQGALAGDDSAGQVLLTQPEIEISFKRIDRGDYGPELVFYATNWSDRPLSVDAIQTSINGNPTDAMYYGDVLPGCCLVFTLNPSWDELGPVGEVMDAVFSFRITEPESYNLIAESGDLYLNFDF